MSATCYSCWYYCGTRTDTCPQCGYHQRTKGRIDGKKNKRNSKESNERVRLNLMSFTITLRPPPKPYSNGITHTYIPTDIVKKHVIQLRAEHGGSMRAAAAYMGVTDKLMRPHHYNGTVATCTAMRVLGEELFNLHYPNVPLCQHKDYPYRHPGYKHSIPATSPDIAAQCGCDKPILITGEDGIRCFKCGLDVQ